MKLASIDIGSNTIRLLVAEAGAEGILPLRHERRVTRLASGMHLSGRISQKNLDATLSVIREFCGIIREEGAASVLLGATSAVRDAENSSDTVRQIQEASGLDVMVLSGDDEARITAMGVLEWLGPVDSSIIFDIGGGSTEFIALRGGELIRSISYPIGVVGLLERIGFSDPPNGFEMDRLDEEIMDIATKVKDNFNSPALAPGSLLIGTAGTATTLASLDMGLEEYDGNRIQGHVLTLGRIRQLERDMVRNPLIERRKIPGMDPQRADLIIAGTRLTIRAMEALDFGEMTVSDHGLLEGLIVRLLREGRQ